MANERSHIHGDIRLLDRAEELCDVERGTTAIANHYRGNAHAHEVLRFRHLCHVISMRVDVDKAGGDDEAGGVDYSPGSRRRFGQWPRCGRP